MDHDRYREWIDLEADGALDASHRRALEVHLETCAECRAERTGAREVITRLRSARVEARPGFALEVMAALEPAAWEARTLRAWRLPFALVLVLAGLAAALFGGAAADLDRGAGGFGALAALADLFVTAATAGAGLLAASWQGLGFAIADWLGASKLNVAAAVGLLVGVNYLLIRLLRRRTSRVAVARSPGRR